MKMSRQLKDSEKGKFYYKKPIAGQVLLSPEPNLTPKAISIILLVEEIGLCQKLQLLGAKEIKKERSGENGKKTM